MIVLGDVCLLIRVSYAYHPVVCCILGYATYDHFFTMSTNPITSQDGTIRYYNLRGQKHREDGPAVILPNGDKVWYLNGQVHRDNGPAIEWADGQQEWHYLGIKLNCSSQEEFEDLLKIKIFW